jgi:hypothetical protein
MSSGEMLRDSSSPLASSVAPPDVLAQRLVHVEQDFTCLGRGRGRARMETPAPLRSRSEEEDEGLSGAMEGFGRATKPGSRERAPAPRGARARPS